MQINYRPRNLVLIVLAILLAVSAFGQEKGQFRPLLSGQPIERELRGGETHSYSLDLKAGQFVDVVVKQKGIDVVVTLLDPQKERVVTIDSPNGTQGPESVQLIVEKTGTHRLEIRTLIPAAPAGRYEATILALRDATIEDRKLIAESIGLPATEPFLRVETGMHEDAIYGAATDADGQFLVTTSGDNTVRVWQMPDAKLLRVIRPPLGVDGTGRMGATAMSPDGKTVAIWGMIGSQSVQEGASVFIFDRESGQLRKTLRHCYIGVGGFFLAFSRDGLYLAVSIFDGIRIYETNTYSMIAEDDSYEDFASGGTFTAKGRLTVTSGDGYLRLYDLPEGKSLHLLARKRVREPYSRFGGPVSSSPDGSKLAVVLSHYDKPGGFFNQAIDILSGDDLSLDHTVRSSEISGPSSTYSIAWSLLGRKLYASALIARPKSALRSWDMDFEQFYIDSTVLPSPAQWLFPRSDGGVIFVPFDPPFGTFLSSADVKLSDDNQSIPGVRASFNKFNLSADGRDFQLSSFTPANRMNAPTLEFSVGQRLLISNPTPKNELRPPITNAPGIDVDWSEYLKPKLHGKLLGGFAVLDGPTFSPNGQKFLLNSGNRLLAFDREGNLLWKVNTSAQFGSINISGDGRFAVATKSDGTICWHRMTDGKKLLSLFVHKDLKRWVLWTPSGYFDASPAGADLIGWHVNRGRDQAADFFPIKQFKHYYRPDVISKILDTGDEARARDDANKENNGQPPNIERLFPPVVEVASPSDNAEISSPSVTVRFSLRTPSGEPVTRVRILIDGRPIGDRQLTMGNGSVPDIREMRITVPQRDSEVSIIAENRFASSVPATIRLKWRGPAPEVEGLVIKPKLYVLSVGISQYQNAAYSLKFAAKDAQDFASAMSLQRGLLYSDVFVKILTDEGATKDDVLDGLDWIGKQTTSKDVAMIFFAGHGTNDQRGYYFLPYNTDMDRLVRTGVTFNDIKSTVQSLAGKTLLFIDSCHSGGVMGGRRGIADDLNGILNELSSAENGAVVFTASTSNQSSLEDEKWDNGAFTKALVEGLLGKADLFGKGKITIKTLDAYLSERVKELTAGKQTPTTVIPNTISDFTIAYKK